MRPENALSPRSRLVPPVTIIHSTPHWSVGEFTWDNEPNVLGIRWNGDIDDENDKGNPRSHGEGTWFVLPKPIADLIRLARTVLDVVCKYESQNARDNKAT
jgi:hypothetical protein